MRKARHNRMTAVHTCHFLVLVISSAFESLCYNRRKILIVTDVDKLGVRYHRCCENPVAVALPYRHNAVGGEKYRGGNIMKFRLLILPAGAEISFQLCVLFQLRITVGGQEFLLHEGQTLIMPKDIPHAVYGEERFKMQLVVSF